MNLEPNSRGLTQPVRTFRRAPGSSIQEIVSETLGPDVADYMIESSCLRTNQPGTCAAIASRMPPTSRLVD